MRRLKRLICNEEGAEMVEFAFAAVVFFSLFFGIVDVCMAVYAGNCVAYAADQGARYGMVRGADWTSACAAANQYGCSVNTSNESMLQNYVINNVPHPGVVLTTSNVTPYWPPTTSDGATCTPAARGCRVQVTVSYAFSLHIPFFPAASIPLTSTSIESIQD